MNNLRVFSLMVMTMITLSLAQAKSKDPCKGHFPCTAEVLSGTKGPDGYSLNRLVNMGGQEYALEKGAIVTVRDYDDGLSYVEFSIADEAGNLRSVFGSLCAGDVGLTAAHSSKEMAFLNAGKFTAVPEEYSFGLLLSNSIIELGYYNVSRQDQSHYITGEELRKMAAEDSKKGQAFNDRIYLGWVNMACPNLSKARKSAIVETIKQIPTASLTSRSDYEKNGVFKDDRSYKVFINCDRF